MTETDIENPFGDTDEDNPFNSPGATGVKLPTFQQFLGRHASKSGRLEHAPKGKRVDCLNDAVFIHDVVTGAILEVNQRACEMYGYSREQFLTKTVLDLVPSEKYIVRFDLNAPLPLPDHPVEIVGNN